MLNNDERKAPYMSFYKLDDCKLELNENGKITEIVFPEKVYGVPTFNISRR